jgi:sodium/potassium/calcium exchanger 2
MVVLLMLVSRIESNSDEEIDISARRLRKNEDDADSGYPFADALIKYPYRQSNNNKWAIIFHVLGICYMMLGLNIVCDAYFCEALTCMCSAWNIQEDVAGATFMAAGGSAPEFFTSIMGVFVAKSDVGFGTIVGSAVFNVLFVIGLCAAASSVPLKLTWWPLFRDCSYYCFGLIVLSIFVWDEKVAAHEAAILFLMYLGYITIMYYNSTLEKKVKDWLAKRSAKVQTEPVSEEPVAGNTEEVLQIALPGMNAANDMVLSPVTPASSSDENNNAAAVEEEPHNVKVERRKSDVKEALEAVRRYSKSFEERRAKPGNGDDDGDNDDDNDDDEEPRGNPFVELWNETDSKERVLRFLAIPIVFPLWLTVPDCTTDKWKNYFMRTFSASILWIALFRCSS